MTKRVLAYNLTGHDNDSYMLGEETRKAETAEEREFFDWRFVKNGEQHPATCSKCGRKTVPNFVDPSFKLRKKSMDISSTYDGYTIVSNKFKHFCEGLSVSGLEFLALPSQSNHHCLVVHNILEVDTESSEGLRFLYFCDLCGRHAGIFGTSSLRFKAVSAPISQGIFRTDLEFAQAHQQSPVIVVGVETGARMKAEKFKGICWNTIQIP